MKLTVASLLLALSLAESDETTYKPQRFPLEALLNDENFHESEMGSSFADALSGVGLVSVSNIPGYASQRKNALSWIHACAKDSKASQDHRFTDGTLRSTLATHTVPGPGGMQNIDHKAESSLACRSLSEASDPLRKTVAEVTKAFASRLSSIIDLGKKPIMVTEDGSYTFNSLADVVENGEHLEHFHSYQKSPVVIKEENTIELHTDQGLFIVFTPGCMIQKGSARSGQAGEFIIQKQDGTNSLVEFDEDDLIFMLGDGVNQYVNTRVQVGGRKLRATPHLLKIPSFAEKEYDARTWYGRMVLPPGGAIHPEHGKTFGELRQLMIDASLDTEKQEKKQNEILGMGCASSLVARQMEETTCAAGSIYCWHRCMEHTEYHPVSPEICQERKLELKCVNPRGQLYVSGHGDYYPDCTNSTQNATDFPTLPAYPTSEEVCTEDLWEKFASSEGYDYSYNVGEYNNAALSWSIVDDKIDARLAYKGLFGFLAFGFAYPGGDLNGMLGASIIMGIPGGNYSAVTGLDLSMNSSVLEYVISQEYTRFRHWSKPVGGDASNYDVVSTDCFTAITFKTDSINGQKFNLTGIDEVLWAANGKDAFCEYHGGDQRNTFYIEWATGKAWLKDVHNHEDHDHDHDDETDQEQSLMSAKSSVSSSFRIARTILALVGGIVLASIHF